MVPTDINIHLNISLDVTEAGFSVVSYAKNAKRFLTSNWVVLQMWHTFNMQIQNSDIFPGSFPRLITQRGEI